LGVLFKGSTVNEFSAGLVMISVSGTFGVGPLAADFPVSLLAASAARATEAAVCLIAAAGRFFAGVVVGRVLLTGNWDFAPGEVPYLLAELAVCFVAAAGRFLVAVVDAFVTADEEPFAAVLNEPANGN
jgi:hypothetical protein